MTILCREVTKYSLNSGAEQAITSWSWLTTGSVGDLANAIDANSSNLWTAIKGKYKNTTAVADHQLQTVDILTGRVTAVTPLALPAAPTGASGADQLPLEVSAVVSMKTALAGARFRGRFYLPAPCIDTLNGDGSFTTLWRTGIVDGFKVFFDAVDAANAGAAHVGVHSRVGLSFSPVTSINMGSIPDAQRRRRGSLVESRYSRNIT